MIRHEPFFAHVATGEIPFRLTGSVTTISARKKKKLKAVKWSEKDMDILNSGSFVPLDNKERMEQLAFTAKTLATEVSRAEGFQNSGPSNYQLGLEMWKGAEYVCRAHEEANIKNIFLSKFLETLREIEKQNAVRPRPPEAQAIGSPTIRPSDQVDSRVTETTLSIPPGPVSLPEPPRSSDPALQQEKEEPADEYLGVVSDNNEIETKGQSYSDECVPEVDADIAAIVDRLEAEDPEPVGTGSEQTEIVTSANASAGQAEPDEPPPTAPDVPCEVLEEEIHTEPGTSAEPRSIESIVLAEKEAYNFDGCTVTAVIQLLPEADGVRKCVVSVRTHDFTPRVAIVDVTTADVLSQIPGALGLVFEQYRNELPARAAEKLKKEKPAAKKGSKSAAKASKATTATAKSDAAPTASTGSAGTEQNQQGLFAS